MAIQYVYPKYLISSLSNDLVWRDENSRFYIPSGALGYQSSTDYTLSGIDEGTTSPNSNDWIRPYQYADGSLFTHSSSPNNPRSSKIEFTSDYVIPSSCILNINIDTVSGEVFGFKGSILNGNDTVAIGLDYSYTQLQSGTELITVPMTAVGNINRNFNPVLNLEFYQLSGNALVEPLNSDFKITAMDILFSGDSTFIHNSCDLHCCGDINLTASDNINIYDDRSTNSYRVDKRSDGIHDIYASFNVDDPNMMSTRSNFSLPFDRMICNEGSGRYMYGANISGTVNQDTAWHYNKNLCSGPSGVYSYQTNINYALNYSLDLPHIPWLNGTTLQVGPYDRNYIDYDGVSNTDTYSDPRNLRIHKAIPSGAFSVYAIQRYGLGVYNISNYEGEQYGSAYMSYTMGSDLSINITKYFDPSTTNNELYVVMKKSDGSNMNMSTTLTDSIERKISRGILLTYSDRARLYGIGTNGNTELLLTSETFTRSNTSGDLSFESSIPVTLSEFGSINSGLSTTDVNRFNDYIYKVFDSVTDSSGDLSRFARINMPQNVDYFNKNYYCTINDQLTVSGNSNLYSIPSGSTLTLSMDVEYTGTNPSGFYLCPYIADNNRTIFSPVGVNDGIRIFPESGVHNILFSSPILYDVTLGSSLLMLDIVSKATHTTYSGGDFSIYGKSLIASPIFEYDPTDINKTLNLHTTSTVDTSGVVDLTVYSPKVSNTVNLFINSEYQTINNSADLYVSGLPMSIGSINLVTKASINDLNSGVDLITYATDDSGLFKTVPMIVASDGSMNSAINLYMNVDDYTPTHSGSINLTVSNNNSVYNNVPLVTWNDASGIFESQQLYVAGNGLYDSASVKYDSMNLFIARDSESTDGSVMMVIATTEEQSNSMDMIVKAANILNSGVDMIIESIDTKNGQVNIYTHGF